MTKEFLWKIESLWEKCSAAPGAKIPNTSLSRDDSFFKPQTESLELTLSENIVFTDDYGSYKGLEDSVLYDKKKPVYIFDNHNKGIMAFLEIKESTKTLYNIVHIDAHPDNAIFQGKINPITQSNIKDIYQQSKISDFLDCAQKGKLINTIERVTNSDSFKNFTPPENPYILSLDIDIFGPEGAFIDTETKIKTIHDAWVNADYVTVATSPGFIDQKFAINLIKIFCK